MKWPKKSRSRTNMLPRLEWLTNRLAVHLVRFAILVVGLLAVSELLMALLTCQDVKYVVRSEALANVPGQ
jgi:hypothetical protein